MGFDGYEFCVLIYDWLNFTINLLLASEDEQLAVGSADFEISGTIYTIVVDEIRKIKKVAIQRVNSGFYLHNRHILKYCHGII